jgi:hypothetical protein
MRLLLKFATYLWVMPISLPALLLALLARAGGAKVRWRDGVLEACGGFLPALLARVYPPMPIAAITLGHVVLAQHQGDLERTRAHERVHVRQYERWGGLFPLIYLGASFAVMLRGGNPYRDNPFEREAFGEGRESQE